MGTKGTEVPPDKQRNPICFINSILYIETVYEGLWYWWGMGYRDCLLETGLIPPRNCPGIYLEFGHCGFRTDHAINLYSSPDLEKWTFVSDILPQNVRPEAGLEKNVIFRLMICLQSSSSYFFDNIDFLPIFGLRVFTFDQKYCLIKTPRSGSFG